MSARRELTLVEVVFSTGLLGVLLAGLFAALGSARRAELYSREHQAASDQAFQLLESHAATPFGTLLELCRDGATPDGYSAVHTQAFDVPYGQSATTSLPPADEAFYPRNADDPDTPADEAAYAARVFVRVPTTGTVELDGDADAVPDVVEIEVVVAWKGNDASNGKLSVKRTKVRP